MKCNDESTSLCQWGPYETTMATATAKSKSNRFKVMLHGTILNDNFKRNTELQCWNNVEIIRTNVATMLQRCVALKIVVANRLV